MMETDNKTYTQTKHKNGGGTNKIQKLKQGVFEIQSRYNCLHDNEIQLQPDTRIQVPNPPRIQ